MISCGDLPPYIGWMSGCTIDTVPSIERASLHISRKCVPGTCHWQSAAVSSWKRPLCARHATFCRASPNFQSAGAVNTGLASPMMTSACTRPASMSTTSCRIAACCSVGTTSGVAMYDTVWPPLPRNSLMACATACTAAGCASPATTIDAPRWAARSAAMASTYCSVPAGAAPVTPFTPSFAAMARAKASTWLAFIGIR